jgi:hypothetical protein
MKLENTTPGQIYETIIDHDSSWISPLKETTILILVTAKPGRLNEPVNYEYLASSDHHFYVLNYKEEMTPVPDSNLPLYIHYPNKTNKFYDLLKGTCETQRH